MLPHEKTIRPAQDRDKVAIRDVIVDAFSNCEFGHNGEADIVDAIHANCKEILSLVAIENEIVVGHVLFSPVSIGTGGKALVGSGLAPLTVNSTKQRAGIGIALTKTGLETLRAAGCPFVVVLGHPDYYARFGFELAEHYGLRHEFDGIPQDVFFVKVFDREIAPRLHGQTAFYRPEFGQQRDSIRSL